MAPRSTTNRPQYPACPVTACEESAGPFDRDLARLPLPALLHEEGRLRRALLCGGRATPALCTRLAAVEAALSRGGGR